MSTKAVSTFALSTIAAITDPNVPFNDQVDTHYGDEMSCEEANHNWGVVKSSVEPNLYGCIIVDDPVKDSDGDVIMEGFSQLTEWGFYFAIVVMAVTAVLQVF